MVLLDSQSQFNFVTESLAQILKKKRQSITMPVFGITLYSEVFKNIRNFRILTGVYKNFQEFFEDLNFLCSSKSLKKYQKLQKFQELSWNF
jgi:hypothetical protein